MVPQTKAGRSKAGKARATRKAKSGKLTAFDGAFEREPFVDEKGIIYRYGYVLPYYTIGDNDTEYLISNPSSDETVRVRLTIMNIVCAPEKPLVRSLRPRCTQGITVAGRTRDNAGMCTLAATKPVVIDILYHDRSLAVLRACDPAQPGVMYPSLARPTPSEYSFNYRAVEPSGDALHGSLFISNAFGPGEPGPEEPESEVLKAGVVFYDRCCRQVNKVPIWVAVKRFCTDKIKFPSNCFGLAVATLSNRALLNVLYFDAKDVKSPNIVAAHQIGEQHWAKLSTGKRI
jgi:hypothetical protein